LKYWLLTTEYPPFFGGGIGTYSAITSAMMADEGHEVSVFVNDTSINNFRIERRSDSLRIIRFNPSRTASSRFLGHVTNIGYEFAFIIKHFIEKEGKPDVIESQEYLGIAYYLLQFKYLLYDWCKDIPVIITMHSPSFLYMEYNNVPEYKYPNYWICEMERFCLQAADLLISPSHFMLEELNKRFQLNNSNVAVIPNPFLGKKTGDENSDLGAHDGQIVFYGKLTVQKGALYLMKYFKELWDGGFSRPLYLIGGQDIVYHAEKMTMGDFIRKHYKKYIENGLLKLEKKVNPADMRRRLAKAEVVIIPSANDNLPYVAFEMMSLGKIVLASRQGGQREIVEDGINGFIFDHDQPETFSKQLNRILDLDRKERDIISGNAVQKVLSLYNPQKIYAQKIQKINKLLEKGSSKNEFPMIRRHADKIESHERSFTKGLLSIVVTFYNSGIYIDDAMRCLEKTDYKEKELIIVNDGSNDAFSLTKLEEYRTKKGIKVIDKQNKGLPDTRNAGAEAAEGEFLTFLDADDKVDPGYYSKAIRALKNYVNLHFVGCWTKYFEGSKNVWPTFNPEPPLILCHNLVNSAALVFKRNSFLSAGKNDLNFTFKGLEDYDTVISVLENGYNGVVIPEILFYYRVRSDSMIRGISTIKKLSIARYISEKHKEFYGTFATEIFNLSNANGPGIFLDNPTLDYDLSDKIRFGGKLTGRIISLVKRNRVAKTIAYKLYRLINK
jgi:glycosyltransferase involved in cell wall biosynthesis